ncbi:hypothetical protein RBH29_07805 [Herbivorax sp. ANBcel31]|uniref:hypothetical protein n=1 Tax=Herbivorax sp. ANBcel31 TaxID=3069754 RepID=UPI0027AF8F59|nr:hypothetical protein [Herbivorax sp. ANBcel31]MDQ2086332.1 hypothetical protein [Herbivorax sp. ANBcel31]
MDDKVRKIFYCDGSFRDIYIKNTEENDWQIFLDFLKREKWTIDFYKDGNIIEYSCFSQEELFKLSEEYAIRMVINIDSITINCNFFSVDEIELDIDPREVINDYLYKEIIVFIKETSKAIKKEIVLTPENCPEYPYLRCKPDLSEIEYLNLD